MEFGIIPDVIFIRNDGWSLGAPKRTAEAAFKLWAGHYVAYLLRPEHTPRPISEYGLEFKGKFCIAHPGVPAVDYFRIPCAPGGRVFVCAACNDKEDPAVLKRVFEAYQCGHGKEISTFKQENPGS